MSQSEILKKKQKKHDLELGHKGRKCADVPHGHQEKTIAEVEDLSEGEAGVESHAYDLDLPFT